MKERERRERNTFSPLHANASVRGGKILLAPLPRDEKFVHRAGDRQESDGKNREDRRKTFFCSVKRDEPRENVDGAKEKE